MLQVFLYLLIDAIVSYTITVFYVISFLF